MKQVWHRFLAHLKDDANSRIPQPNQIKPESTKTDLTPTLHKITRSLWLSGNLLGFLLTAHSSAEAQIAADDTVGTKVTKSGATSEITGGKQRGTNLFHSFQEFSVPNGGTAAFKNTAEIGNIIGRVTGSSASSINGLIKANGNANLIMINPNGIDFGANARLDIGGSFLGSTADSVLFDDGKVFSAKDTQADPLLTISVPVGLQLGQNPETINVIGQGHDLSVADPLFSPVIRGKNRGFSVKPNRTLALVGGDLVFDGGIVSAPGGQIELGSVAAGQVSLSNIEQGWNLGYENITAFQNIQLRAQALADASSTPFIPGGSIQVHGEQMSLDGGSLLLVQNLAEQGAGAINVNASESLTVSGTNPSGIIRSSLTNETVGAGKGGNVNITTNQLTVDEGATLVAKTLSPGTGKGGNIKIDATDSVQVIGANQVNPDATSSIVTASFGAGDSGNNTITTTNLEAIAGGTIASTSFNAGAGGNLSVAAEDIQVRGIEPNVFAPSALTATTLGSGNAGSLTIDTSTLTVLNGGRIDASTAATGNAGSVTIDANSSVEIQGTVPDSVNPSLIISSANILDPALQELLKVPAVPSGNSGNITINTPQLKVTEGAQVTVRNDGSGDAGNLEVNANSIVLDTQGGISASTQVGQGGNIDLQIKDIVDLKGGSQISSDNFGAKDGGNVNIDVNKLSISDRSFITTTTFGQGKGGDININASESFTARGTGFAEFQQTFQLDAFTGKLQPSTRGTGIFIGTAASGIGGNLTIDTPSLQLQNGAIFFSPVFAAGNGGNINLDIADLEIVGSTIQSGTLIGSSKSTKAGDIKIQTERLNIQDGGTLVNATIGEAAGGDISITAELIDLSDTPPETAISTGIYANTTIGSGDGGNIELLTGTLNLREAVIASNTGALFLDGTVIPQGGKGGNVNIKATDLIKIGGIPDNPELSTVGIGTTTYSNSNAGNLTLLTNKLLIEDGADISAATLGSGEGGNLTVDATESIELIGTTTIGGLNRGGIFAASGRANLPNFASVSGNSGSIEIDTGALKVKNGAAINAQSLGLGDAGNLDIAADSILLSNQGNLSADTQSGTGGNIQIDTGTLKIDRGLIDASVFADGAGGNVQINARDSIEANGLGFDSLLETLNNVTSLTPEFFIENQSSSLIQGIVAATTGKGKAGKIEIATSNLKLSEGAFIGTASLGTGTAGSLDIDASGLFKVDNSIVTASTLQTGQGGNIDIDTGSLEVLAGGQVIASTLGSGNGGNLTIDATDSITVDGTLANNLLLPDGGTGAESLPGNSENRRDSSVESPRQLNISNNSAISVGSTGTGDAGTLGISANSIALDRQGAISAASQSGVGGNINLQSDFLTMRRQSQVSATSEGIGDGGNISIRGLNGNNLVVLSENSDITANAFQGAGGNIQLETQALFVCPECNISASSQLGVDGRVALNVLQPNPNIEAVDLPQQLTQPDQAVALACAVEQKANSSELIVTGRGGLPPRPNEPLSSESIISFESPESSASGKLSSKADNSTLPPPAHSWHLNSQGEVVLAAKSANAIPLDSRLNSPDCHVR